MVPQGADFGLPASSDPLPGQIPFFKRLVNRHLLLSDLGYDSLSLVSTVQGIARRMRRPPRDDRLIEQAASSANGNASANGLGFGECPQPQNGRFWRVDDREHLNTEHAKVGMAVPGEADLRAARCSPPRDSGRRSRPGSSRRHCQEQAPSTYQPTPPYQH